MGLGIFLNGIEGSVKQIRRALAATPAGVVLYAIANPDAAVDSTPVRGFTEFAAALTKPTAYDPNPDPVFAEDAFLPQFPWKTAPATGHLMGYANRPSDGAALDTATVYIFNAEGALVRTTATDGHGFFGAVDLPPGEYALIIERGPDRQIVTRIQVRIGSVTTVTEP
jgi:hypothetical protein